ncbi:MAG: hypothetical protein M0019_04420 [Actinomycetota bacterium]|nr:hypothetical protein [Actinomycetota bacterium]
MDHLLEAAVNSVYESAINGGNLDSLPTEQLKATKRLAEEAEAKISFARRMIQGRIDTLELDPSRLGSGQSDIELSPLKSAINSQGAQSSFGRFVDADISQEQVDQVDDELSSLISEAIARMDSEQSNEVKEKLALVEVEHYLSGLRKKAFSAIDAINAELVVRYRTEPAMVDSLLNRFLDSGK